MTRSIPYIEDGLLHTSNEGAATITLAPGSPAWWAWLDDPSTRSFAFHSPDGRFTVRKERKQRGGVYWIAYRKVRGKLHNRYLGRSADLTLERFNAVAAYFAALANEAPEPASLEAPVTEQGDTAAPDLPLLAAKLQAPLPQTRLVARERLIARLDAGLTRRVSLVVAPPGFGKTTLVSVWAQRRAQPPAWLALDANDDQFERFLRYLVAALQTIAPEVGERLHTLLNAPFVLESLLTALVNNLATLPAGSVLVLDDYHLLREPQVHAVVRFLLDHPLPTLHLVIVTREDPPLPLARLRGSGALAEIRAADLRFTRDEAAAFLRDGMGLTLTAEQVAVLERRTEGWVAGLQFAALSLRDQPPEELEALVAAFSGSNRFVVDYLAEEALRRLPSHLRSFLLQTAILDRMCGPLCDAVLGVMDDTPPSDQRQPDVDSYSRLILDELERANMFLVPLDDRREWYRYHTLFQGVLRMHLAAGVSADAIAALHRRAALWFAAHSLPAEAAVHRRAAGEPEETPLAQPLRGAAQAALGAALPLDTASSEAASLPLPATSFVGRTAELSQIGRALNDPTSRLITLVGPGGIGKTRLALQAAAEYRARFPDGVVFVQLAPVTTAARISEAIGEALGIVFVGGVSPAVQVMNYLRERTLLLILDNFEHLLDGVDLIADLLQAAPRLWMLVTSRAALYLHGEMRLDLHGLPVRATPPTAQDDDGALGLFLQRAQRVRQGFAPDTAELTAIQTICRTVEGMPLAIELAAAWVRSLTCAEIARELTRNQELLSTVARDIPERHRSLRAAFDHSWSLLNAIERRALRRLAVFRSSFTREAAAMVLGNGVASPANALLTLTSLVDKSLLRLARDAQGATRYEIHELIRQYGAFRLAEDAAEEADARARHAAYYADWVAQQELAIRSAAQKATLNAISADIDNVRAAWEWGVAHRDASLLHQMVYTISWFYEVRGWWQEGASAFAQGSAVLRPLIAQEGAPATSQATYWLLISLEGWNLVRSEPVRAVELFTSALAALRQLGDRKALFYPLIHLSYVSVFGGDPVSTRALLDEAFTTARAVGSAWAVAIALNVQAVLEVVWSAPAEAHRRLRQSLVAARAVGDPRTISLPLNYMGMTALALGNPDEALRYVRESLAISVENHDRYQTCLALQHLGLIAQARGDAAEAESLLNEGLDLAREIGDRWLEAQALTSLGRLAAAQGNVVDALALLRTALTAATAAPLPIALDTLAALADLELDEANDAAALAALAYLRLHPLTRPATRAQADRRWSAAEKSVLAPLLTAAEREARLRLAEHPVALLPLFDDDAFALEAAPAPQIPLAPAPAHPDMVEPLTERELEVLILVAAGLSNQAIADQLIVAVGTVKRHLNSIFGKLDVQSRVQAIARARELGLI